MTELLEDIMGNVGWMNRKLYVHFCILGGSCLSWIHFTVSS